MPSIAKEGIGRPRTGVTDICEPPCGNRGLKPWPSGRTANALTNGPSLHPLHVDLPLLARTDKGALTHKIRPSTFQLLQLKKAALLAQVKA